MWPFKPKLANTERTSKKTILEQMNEMRPLPMGMTQFNEFCDRIISGALIPTTNRESLVKTLAFMLTQLGPQEDHKPDAYFIKSLRKAATNQVASQVGMDIQEKQRKEFEEKKKQEEEANKLTDAHKGAENEKKVAQALADDKAIQEARISNLLRHY